MFQVNAFESTVPFLLSFLRDAPSVLFSTQAHLDLVTADLILQWSQDLFVFAVCCRSGRLPKRTGFVLVGRFPHHAIP